MIKTSHRLRRRTATHKIEKSPEQLREYYINYFSWQKNNPIYRTMSERDAEYNLRAYEQMSEREIILSEQRRKEYVSKRRLEFVKQLRQ
jgi:DNA modification methylase